MRTVVVPRLRPKDRRPLWTCRVYGDDDGLVFDNAWVSLQALTEPGAAFVAACAAAALASRLVARLRRTALLPGAVWTGDDVDDDAFLEIGRHLAHAEHLTGALRRGGVWFLGVTRDGDDVFREAGALIVFRSAAAARWFAELIILLDANGVLPARADDT